MASTSGTGSSSARSGSWSRMRSSRSRSAMLASTTAWSAPSQLRSVPMPAAPMSQCANRTCATALCRREAGDRRRHLLRPLEEEEVARLVDRLEPGVRDPLREDAAVKRRHEPVLLPPEHERRRADARQPLLEPALGNWEEELRDRAEAAQEADQELDLL